MRLSPYYIPVVVGLALGIPAFDASAQVSVGITISAPIAPPPLPVYVQPPIPEEGYLWTPGYWAYDEDGGYYWVPGTWVRPPTVGLLWTPPYWGFVDGFYGFHGGYWGPHIGFYGGINYGFGYGGIGFQGGFWDRGGFRYNRAVNNFGGTHITNVYNKTVNNTTINRTAFNGPNGVQAKPTPEEEAAAREPHQERTAEQTAHFEAAKGNPELRASANHGRPAIAATAKPGDFKGPGAMPARAAGPGAGMRGPNAGAAGPNPGPGAAERRVPTRPNTPGMTERPAAGYPAAPRAPQPAPGQPRPQQPQAARAAPPPAPHPAPAPRPAPAQAPGEKEHQ